MQVRAIAGIEEGINVSLLASFTGLSILKEWGLFSLIFSKIRNKCRLNVLFRKQPIRSYVMTYKCLFTPGEHVERWDEDRYVSPLQVTTCEQRMSIDMSPHLKLSRGKMQWLRNLSSLQVSTWKDEMVEICLLTSSCHMKRMGEERYVSPLQVTTCEQRMSIDMSHHLKLSREKMQWLRNLSPLRVSTFEQRMIENVTPEQRNYLIGKLYNEKKKGVGGDRKSEEISRANILPLKTSEKIAEEYNVSHQTVKNAGLFADVVDTNQILIWIILVFGRRLFIHRCTISWRSSIWFFVTFPGSHL